MAEEEIKETAAAAEAPAATEEVKVKKGKKRIDIQAENSRPVYSKFESSSTKTASVDAL